MGLNIEEIIIELKENADVLYREGALQLFIDNQINLSDLKKILLVNHERSLPQGFNELSDFEKKKYYAHTTETLEKINGQWVSKKKTYYNKNYFFEMYENARKYTTWAEKIMKYINEFGDENVNLLFYCTRFVYCDMTPIYRIPSLKKYILNSKKAYTIFTLLCDLYEDKSEKGIENLNKINDLMKNGDITLIDYDNKKKLFLRYAFLVEMLLNKLPKKEANMIKVYYKILNKTDLRTEDLILEKDGVDESKIISRCLKHFVKLKHNEEILNEVLKITALDCFYPNGYSVFINSVFNISNVEV